MAPLLPAAASPPKVAADVLVDSQGMTLYTYALDEAGSGQSNCNGDCAFLWPPLLAGDGKAGGRFSIIAREGGARQWAFKGKPLYLFSGDANPGDTTGSGVNGLWRVAMP